MKHLLYVLAATGLLTAAPLGAQTTFEVISSQFTAGLYMTAPATDSGTVAFVLQERGQVPFTQTAVHQTPVSQLGVHPAGTPYYHVRLALPIPSAYTPTECGQLAGLDYGNYHHHHSPGFVVLPNGDALAIAFSSPRGRTENDTMATFVQYRLRYGSEEWDMPELFFDTRYGNDQSGLLWQDGDKTWFFGGGRDLSDWVPFRLCTSTDNGQTWTFGIPQLDSVASGFTAQPITCAFRDPQGNIYMASDGKGSESFLWRSADEGIHWHDMGGRTSTRHSTIVPLDGQGTLLAVGGKNNNINGWNPQNISRDWGATWEPGTQGVLPVLGSAQRPCIIRLASGSLVVVGDSYLHKLHRAAPEGWPCGDQCYIGLSDDNGQSWSFKALPLCMGHNQRPQHPSLGYTTVRQSPDGTIHILSSATYPAYHIELNEAWIRDAKAGVALAEKDGKQIQDQAAYGFAKGKTKKYRETYADGQVRSRWSALVCRNGRYLLHGRLTDYYADGTKMHEAVYDKGYKTGTESYWAPDGSLIWTWQRDRRTQTGVWTQYWSNGQKKVQSTWNLQPSPRDLPDHVFAGYVAQGDAFHWDRDGQLTATVHFENGLPQEP